mgnify:CR=1 FL=1
MLISRAFFADEADAVTDQMEAPLSPSLQQKKEKYHLGKKTDGKNKKVAKQGKQSRCQEGRQVEVKRQRQEEVFK